jgi:hypothetical protein
VLQGCELKALCLLGRCSPLELFPIPFLLQLLLGGVVSWLFRVPSLDHHPSTYIYCITEFTGIPQYTQMEAYYLFSCSFLKMWSSWYLHLMFLELQGCANHRDLIYITFYETDALPTALTRHLIYNILITSFVVEYPLQNYCL